MILVTKGFSLLSLLFCCLTLCPGRPRTVASRSHQTGWHSSPTWQSRSTLACCPPLPSDRPLVLFCAAMLGVLAPCSQASSAAGFGVCLSPAQQSRPGRMMRAEAPAVLELCFPLHLLVRDADGTDDKPVSLSPQVKDGRSERRTSSHKYQGQLGYFGLYNFF